MTPGTRVEPREDLAGLTPYASPQLPARYRMNTNESPYPPPEVVVEEILEGLGRTSWNRYPDAGASDLLDELARATGRPGAGLAVANGSNEVFLHLFQAFGGPGRRSMTFEPTYPLHTLIPRITGTDTVQVHRADDWLIDLDDAIEQIGRHRPDLVLVCSPNNPTGGVEPLDGVRALLAECDGLVVVDEAYGEFAHPQASAVSLIDEHDNLVVVRTFSKAWRLAGVRIGYLMASASITGALAKVRLPYHLSAVAQLFGTIALRHSDEMVRATHLVTEERDRVAVELQAMGVKVWPSQANFVLFEIDDAPRVWKALLDDGVLVRNYDDAPHLRGCLRVTAGLPEETDAFLAALRGALDG